MRALQLLYLVLLRGSEQPASQVLLRAAPYRGVTHWLDTSSTDGTTVDLFDFDFTINPKLRLEIYGQDEDGTTPFDNHVLFWNMGVGQAAAHLNSIGRGPVIAAWNG